MTQPLSPLQQRVFDVLNATPNKDAHIWDLFRAAYPNETSWPVRDMQQRLGPVFQRINSKLPKGRVRPGTVKQTYRYDTKG